MDAEDKPSSERRRRQVFVYVLVTILAAAAVARLVGNQAGLPLVFFGDEVDMINHALGLSFQDLNPHMFVWGSFPFYLFRSAATLADWLSVAVGHPMNAADYYVLGRTVSAVFSVATVLLVFFLGKSLGNWTGGLLAAGVMAFSPYAAVAAHYATAEPILGFWSTLVVVGLVTWQAGWPGGKLLTGVALGLAMATKYNAACLAAGVGAIALLHEWPNRMQDLGRYRLPGFTAVVLVVGISGLTFFVLQEHVLSTVQSWTASGELQPFYRSLFQRFLTLTLAAAAAGGGIALGARLRLSAPRFVVRFLTSPSLLGPLAIAGVVFIAAEPFAVLDFPAFAQGVAFSLRKQELGAITGYDYGSRLYAAASSESALRAPLYYPNVVWDQFGPVAVLAMLLGLGVLSHRKREVAFPLAAVLIAIFGMLATARYHGVRYLYPIWGLLAVLAGLGMEEAIRTLYRGSGWVLNQRARTCSILTRRASEGESPVAEPVLAQRVSVCSRITNAHLARLAIVVVLIALLILPLIHHTWTTIEAEFFMPDTRTAALEWLQLNVDSGAKVVRERDTLQVEFSEMKVRVTQADQLFEGKTLSDWEKNGTQVFVIGDNRRAFYRRHADRFADVLQEYEKLSVRGRRMHFAPGDGFKGPVIDVYMVP